MCFTSTSASNGPTSSISNRSNCCWGPQGVTGGKNTTVGDVVIKTQLPSFERKATVETTFANYSHVIEKLNVTGPIIDDKLAYRVAFYLDKGDGWINDAVTGAGLLNNNRWGARGQLLYTGDEITDRLIFNYGTSHETNNSTTGIFGNSFLMYANGTMSATYAADARKSVWACRCSASTPILRP